MLTRIKTSLDRTNEEFEREVAERLSLDLERPKRSRRKKDPDPDDPGELEEIFGDLFEQYEDDGTLLIAEEEQTFWLSTYRKDTAFMQVCHCSDRMSAIFGTNLERDVSVPLLLDESLSLQDAEKAFSDIQTVTPTCLWISTSDKSSVAKVHGFRHHLRIGR